MKIPVLQLERSRCDECESVLHSVSPAVCGLIAEELWGDASDRCRILNCLKLHKMYERFADTAAAVESRLWSFILCLFSFQFSAASFIIVHGFCESDGIDGWKWTDCIFSSSWFLSADVARMRNAVGLAAASERFPSRDSGISGKNCFSTVLVCVLLLFYCRILRANFTKKPQATLT